MRLSHTIAQLTSLLAITSMLTACTEPDGSPGRGIENGGALSKEDVGTAAGTIGGGVIGSTIGGGAGKTVAIVGGALLGGMLGNTIGKSLDNADRSAYDSASQQALESGEVQSWSNPDSHHHGVITPRNSYTNYAGQTCREYTQTVYINGRPHEGHGTACRDDNGTWQISNN